MKWFLGLMLTIALIVGAAYGVGRFLLPNSLSVTRTATILRPRATVFAMINDLNRVKEWAPFNAQDPETDYTISGPAGEGQRMHWTSSRRDIGNGLFSIVNSDENQSIQGILEIGDNATFNTDISIVPQAGATRVSWSVAARCDDGWINVPCRYMNLISRRNIEHELDNGLGSLKRLTEQLPNVDFEGLQPENTTVSAHNVIFVDVTISKAMPTMQDREIGEQGGVDALDHFVTSSGAQVNRHLVRVFPSTQGTGGQYRFSVGYELQGAPPDRLIGVRVGQTPSGGAIEVHFVGHRSQIPMMYQQINAYMQAHRITPRPDTDAWEIVQQVDAAADSPDDPIEHTDIYYPVTSSASESG